MRDRAGTVRTSPARTRHCGYRSRTRSQRESNLEFYRMNRVRLGLAPALLVALAPVPAAAQRLDSLRSRIVARIARAPAQAVGVYFRDLDGRDSMLVSAGKRFHAASTMKVPVMIQVFRDRDARTLSLDDSLLVHDSFPSLVYFSLFAVDTSGNSHSTLFQFLDSRLPLPHLLELIET